MYPKCGSTTQSPINIETNLLVKNETLGRFNRSIFDKIHSGMVYVNNGHARKLFTLFL